MEAKIERQAFSALRTFKKLKRLHISLFAMLLALTTICQAQDRLRNTIYVLDCTRSMGGYNGSPNIWVPTKNFLKAELEKEARENPNAKVTVLPFQEKVLHPINVNLNDISWSNLENVLDGYVEHVTATNICDSWLEAEKLIDQSDDNYIVLMTDGHDNIGGTVNEANRTARLGQILREFCGKYQNTKGFYVELTSAASLPPGIQDAIDICSDLYKIDATGGIPSFGCASEEVININTRDLPGDITLGFSNSGTFAARLDTLDNPYVTFSVKDNKICQGKVVLHVESKFGDDTETLNKAINASAVNFTMKIESDEVIITNPELDVVLHTTPLRTLDLNVEEAKVMRVTPFLWVKGNPSDTLRWNLDPVFSEEAVSDNSFVMFRLRSDKDLASYSVQFNGGELHNDSIIIIRPGQNATIEVIIPAKEKDGRFNLSLNEITAGNLDRLNGIPRRNSIIMLKGSVDTKTSIAEIVFWSILGLIALFLFAWFGFIRNQKYPKFKRGIITIQQPYFATLRVKGYRMVVFSPSVRKQSMFDKIWRGTILYHTNAVWVCDAEVHPSGRNMRFRCPSGSLICSPQPLLMSGQSFDIINPSDVNAKIVININ